ncbi:hypothetical protein [Gordonia sp. SL306]|uniref:hypothetical protein n=1 Tax=Gordonia sp. SL306 TaxID=2995145 RepID=UPI00226EBF8B|nr:hypothetical protein [Gordonia sp. SL306]WAC57266.1 hypothetical protein OVA31_08530 [Gordonia sp. SL306]
MKRRMALVVAGSATAVSIGMFVAPTAGAAPVEPHQAAGAFGSVSICVAVPVPPPLRISICI